MRAFEEGFRQVSLVRRWLNDAARLFAASRDFADAVALTWHGQPLVFRLSLLLLFGAMAAGQVLQHTRAPMTLVAWANAIVGTRPSTAGRSARPSIVDLARAVDDHVFADLGREIGLWRSARRKEVKVRAGMKAVAG